MINWLIYYFILFGVVLRLLFSLETALWLNGLVFGLARGFYLFCFYLYYFKFPNSKDRVAIYGDPTSNTKANLNEKPELGFNRKRFLIEMGMKNGALFFLCLFSMPLATLIAMYSLLIGSAYIRHIGFRWPKKVQGVLVVSGTYLFNILVFVGFAFGIFWLNPQYDMGLPIDIGLSIGVTAMLVFAVLGIIFYLFPGKLFTRVSFSYYNRKILGKLQQKTRVIVLGSLIIVPSVFLAGMIAFSIPRTESVMVEMRDGVKLATDVYYSPLVGRNPAPVVLIRSPYGIRESAPEMDFATYGSMGCHVVLQDIRGTFESEGVDTTIMFINDASDGYDTIEWIMAQEWCNGKVLGSGTSAMAIAQYLLAGTGPEGLVTQSLYLGTPDVIADAILDGATHQHLIETWSTTTCPGAWRLQQNYLYDSLNNMASQDTVPIRSVELLNAPNTFAQVNVAALHVAGWYDIFLGGSLRGYKGYDKLGGELARGRQKLIIGPWGHGMWGSRTQGELYYPSTAIGSSLISEWEQFLIDEIVFGNPHTEQWENRVAYYVMGDVDDPNVDANKWKYAKDWPLEYRLDPWYFGQKDGRLTLVDDSTNLDGALNCSYLFDPVNPIETKGGNNLFSSPMGPADQRSVEQFQGELRDDLLLFQSDVLTSPYTIEGDLTATLYVTSNCTDTDFMVKLCDVYPDGRRMLIRDGALTTRFRDVDFTAITAAERRLSENFLVPGQVYEITINLLALAYQFNKGHRIAITISSSNNPRFSINANTGGPLSQSFTEGVIANNTILTGPGLSSINMPVL